ncbi:MAG: guanylate kinase [Eubacteriaceae bacterium]|nr:guanylate kinase [Eubacteriaceae bacterium]MDD4507616.1 guanylate kinase [Eubacteriaceae bacterium]
MDQEDQKFFSKERGLLIVVSGPSCAGKGTVCKIVRENHPEYKMSISETTRSPRPKEINGIDYFFVTEKEFLQQIDQGAFLEYAKVYDHYYGTPRKFVNTLLEKGQDVILEIDIQGAAKVRNNYKEGIYIFIAPPSMKELRNRIEKRGTEDPKQMEMRLGCAYDEMTNAADYSYIVINDDKDVAAGQVEAIIEAEKCRTERLKNKVDGIIERVTIHE